MTNDQLINSFTRFANVEAKDSSPLYEYWCKQIILDDKLLQLIQHIPASQPKPNLFFAAVQYLSFQLNDSFTYYFEHPEESVNELSFSALQHFCAVHHDKLIELFQTKLVQTNEVQRASYLYPLFEEIYKKSNKPLTLIEIGTSAGLLLSLDAYQYEIQQNQPIHFGDNKSPLLIEAKNLGEPLASVGNIDVAHRIGIDLNCINLQDEADFKWLQALIWPEHSKRKENLLAARDIHLKQTKTLVEGDFRELIPNFCKEYGNEMQIIIFHTHVANQFSSQLKEDLMQMLTEISTRTPLYHVYNNIYDHHLHVDFINNREVLSIKELVNTDGHGNYFYWQ